VRRKRRSRKVTGAKRSRSTPSPGRVDRPRTTLRARPGRRRLASLTLRGRSSPGPRIARDRLPDGLLYRRDSLRGNAERRSTNKGLPTSVLSLRRRDENASDNQTTRSVCTRKKATRRAVLIATGYGGINGARQYKEHKKCR